MLLDSNIVISAARPGGQTLANYLEDPDACVSIVTTIEVLGYHRMTADEERILNRYLASIPVLPLNDAIASRAIALRKQRKMGVPDAIIAATALEWDLPLVTHNTDDFKHIEGLTLIAPPAAT